MKIENYTIPKSSFLSMEKDSALIIKKILNNENLKKLLYYPDRNCLKMPNLTQDQTYSLIGKNIRMTPKLPLDDFIESYIIISYDNFLTNGTNPEFRDNIISFDILCQYDNWDLGDFKLRPYKIAGELDAMFNNVHLTGIGELQFMGGRQLLLTNDLGGISLSYMAIHGEEDKK